MDALLEACGRIFDKSTQPFGVAHVILAEDGSPTGFTYEYLNPAMARFSGQTPEELLHFDPYAFWPDSDPLWLDYFYRAAYEEQASEFEVATVVYKRFLHVSVFPIEEGYCGFSFEDVMRWAGSSSPSMSAVSAGMFFYDLHLDKVFLEDSALSITKMEDEYMDLRDFCDAFFGPEFAMDMQERMARVAEDLDEAFLQETQMADGRWLRFSLAHIGQTDRFALGMIEDVTRVKEAEARNALQMEVLENQAEVLQASVELAESANRAKSVFLTNMSHDFRTPMNAITGFANIALDNLDDVARVRDCLEKIVLSSDHLLDLVNDILDVSKVESGKLSITEAGLSIASLIDNIEAVFSDEALERGIEFDVHVAVEHDSVLGDQLRLNQMLVNLLGNAFKFTAAGGSVALAITEGPAPAEGFRTYAFSVEDTGCGIPEEFIERMFLPFERHRGKGQKAVEGTGLGMTITKSLVELMGGTLEVQSEEGAGTRFCACIPLKHLDAIVNKPIEAREAALRDFRGLRALIADDDELSSEILSDALRRRGFEVEAFSDGDEALEAVADSVEFYYDIVLLDLRMPTMNGDVAASRIRALDRADAASLPIVAVTADAFEEVRKRALSAGMNAHVTKPLKVSHLMSVISELL